MSDAERGSALAEAEAPEDAPAGWAIRSVGEADWALERIAQARREMAEVDAQFDAAVQRLEERRAQLRREPQRTVDFFSAHLRMWAEGQKDAICSGKRKSRAMLHGRVGWRAKPLRLVINDTAALREWAHGLEYMRESVDTEAVRAHFKAQGEVPPDCSVEGGADTFYVETEGE